jgi:5'-methylthioadenosine phosphorylase
MHKSPIPQVDHAIICGSSLFSIQFPEDLHRSDVEIIERDMIFSTPYGDSPAFTRFRCKDKEILTVRMHGWRPNIVTRGVASQQLFWVLAQAGVKKILAEGGVGSINHLLELRDYVIPNDYIDNSMRKDVGLGEPYLLIMRDPVCPKQAYALVQSARKQVDSMKLEGRPRHVFERGIYVNTDGRHFESKAEVQMFRTWHGDVVGQSMCPEVYLAREIGACYAGIYMVVNYAEGIIQDWDHQELTHIFYEESHHMGHILLDAIHTVDVRQEACECINLRKKTLLNDLLKK